MHSGKGLSFFGPGPQSELACASMEKEERFSQRKEKLHGDQQTTPARHSDVLGHQKESKKITPFTLAEKKKEGSGARGRRKEKRRWPNTEARRAAHRCALGRKSKGSPACGRGEGGLGKGRRDFSFHEDPSNLLLER